MSSIKPTDEQLAIVEASKKGNVVVDAVAGGSKTTSLTLVANANPVKTLYLAFNKIAAEEAKEKFPPHVECRTQHSIAYAVKGLEIAHKLARPKGQYVNVAGTGGEIARYYRLDGYSPYITAAGVGVLIKKAVQRFEQSDSDTLTKDHLPWGDIKSFTDKGCPVDLINDVFNTAKKMWQHRINANSNVLATHDTYLKMYQLTKPKLKYDMILLDEGQDSSMCVLDIFNNQNHAKRVLVGDDRQSIYQWRGSVNAMKLTDSSFKRMNLSQSFRYGDSIAKVAEQILKGAVTVKGFNKILSVVGDDVVNKEKPYTVLYRTNAALLTEAVDHLEALEAGMTNKQLKIEIDVQDFVKIVISAQALYEGRMKDVKHESIVPYTSFDELIEAGEEDGELKRVAAIVGGGRGKKVIDLLEYYVAPKNPHITFTTAHKSKGLEYDQVILANDFPSHYDNKGRWKGLAEGEENLLYVAATRAKLALNINSSVEEAINYMKSGRGKPWTTEEKAEFESALSMYDEEYTEPPWN